jgi:MFS family permease
MDNTVQEKSSSDSLVPGSLVVFAAFIAFGLVYGMVLYSFTIFVNPVAKAFGASVADVQLAFAATNVGTGILGILGGMLLARYSKRLCIVAGLAVMAASFYGLSMVTVLWQFIALYGIAVAFGASLAAPMGASAIVNNWFIKYRGRALTCATMGTSFGQLVIPKLVAAPLIAAYGWQTAYQAFAGILVVIGIPLIFLLVTDHPEEKGLKAYGADELPATGIHSLDAPLPSTGEILSRGDFWTIAISYILGVFVYLGLLASMGPYARGLGFSAADAATLVFVSGMAAIAGKIFFATFTDQMGLRNTMWIALAMNSIALICLLTMKDFTGLAIASASVGAAAGGLLPVWPGLVAFRFGRHTLPKVMGLMGPIVVSLQGFGATIAAKLHYQLAFEIFLGLMVVSAVVSINLSKPATS